MAEMNYCVNNGNEKGEVNGRKYFYSCNVTRFCGAFSQKVSRFSRHRNVKVDGRLVWYPRLNCNVVKISVNGVRVE